MSHSKPDPRLPATWGGPLGATDLPKSDAELLALERELDAALAEYRAAQKDYDARQESYLAEKPAVPERLLPNTRGRRHPPSRNMFWTARDLRGFIPHAPEQLCAMAREDLPVAMAYEAEVERLARKHAIREAEARHEATFDRVEDLAARVETIAAQSIAGLAVKARVIRKWGRSDWWTPGSPGTDWEDRTIVQILDFVIRLAGPELHQASALRAADRRNIQT